MKKKTKGRRTKKKKKKQDTDGDRTIRHLQAELKATPFSPIEQKPTKILPQIDATRLFLDTITRFWSLDREREIRKGEDGDGSSGVGCAGWYGRLPLRSGRN